MPDPVHRLHSAPVVRAALLLVLTALPYLTIPGNEFVSTDDPTNIYHNPLVLAFTPEHLRQFWTAPFYGLYTPVTYTVWGALATVGRLSTPMVTDGMGSTSISPLPFHVAGLLLHLVCTLLVFDLVRRVLRRLFDRDPGWAPFWGALLFGLHPIQVEAVAWATGMNNTLSAAFALGATIAYLAARERAHTARAGRSGALLLFAAFVLYVLGFLAKPTAVALPAALFALDVIVVQTPARVATWALLQWVAAAILPVWVAHAVNASATDAQNAAIWQRPFIVGDTIAFTMTKLVAPVGLCFDYGRSPQIVGAHWWGYVTWLLPTAIGIVAWRGYRTGSAVGRGLWAAFLFFVLSLLPVLGLVPTYFQPFSSVADRYLYLPMAGAALAAGVVASAVQDSRRWSAAARKGFAAGAVVLTVCAIAGTALQALNWTNSITLFNHTIEVNPDSAIAYQSIPTLYIAQGRLDKAEAFYRRAVSARPNMPAMHDGLGWVLQQETRFPEAEAEYRTSVRLDPSADELFELGAVLDDESKLADCETALRAVLRQDPRYRGAAAMLGGVLLREGRHDDAVEAVRQGLAADPNAPELREAWRLMHGEAADESRP
jgi:Tfp pilus assembly protein PilF